MRQAVLAENLVPVFDHEMWLMIGMSYENQRARRKEDVKKTLNHD
jgi:hypothetical protein